MIKIILFIIGIGLIVAGIYLTMFNEKIRYVGVCLLGVLFIGLGSSFYFVPTGYVAVRRSYGQIAENVGKSGTIWKVPFTEEIHLVNCKIQEKDFGDQKIWGESSERTEIYCQNVVVDYQIEPKYASWIWSNIEEYDTKLVKDTNVNSGIKSATKMFDDVNVTDRNKIEEAAKEEIQKSLNSKYKNQVVTVVSVTIGHMNFSDAYNEAIEAKSKAKLEADTAAENERKAKIESEGKAERARIEAEGEADAIKIKAQAESDANKMISDSLTDKVLESKKIDRWDGKLPTVQGVDSSPIININSNKEKDNE